MVIYQTAKPMRVEKNNSVRERFEGILSERSLYEKETICKIRLFTSGFCGVDFPVEIGCRKVVVTISVRDGTLEVL